MFARLFSMGLYGVEAFPVEVEVDVSRGMPCFDMVGLPDAAVKEARNRVRSALKNCGFDFPINRITVNLAPADRRKESPVYDLPLLAALLCATEQLDASLIVAVCSWESFPCREISGQSKGRFRWPFKPKSWGSADCSSQPPMRRKAPLCTAWRFIPSHTFRSWWNTYPAATPLLRSIPFPLALSPLRLFRIFPMSEGNPMRNELWKSRPAAAIM